MPPGVPTTDSDPNIKEELPTESLPTAEEELSFQSDSPAIIAKENEELDASGGS